MAEKKVAAIVGGQNNSDALVQPIIDAAGIPQIGIGPISPAANTSKNNFFFNVPSQIVYESLAAYFVKRARLTPVAGAVTDNAAGQIFIVPIENTLKQVNNGTGFQPLVKVGPRTPDFAPVGASIAATGAKSIVLPTGGDNLWNTVRAVEAQSRSMQRYGFGNNVSVDLLRTSGGTAVMNKSVIASTYPPLTDRRMAAFRRDIDAQRKRGDINADINKLQPRDVDAWVGLKVLVAVTKGLNAINASTVTAALNRARNVNVGPFLPRWTPTAPGPNDGNPRASNTAVWFTGFRNGAPYLLVDHPVELADAIAGKF
jgi:hypothetical protein